MLGVVSQRLLAAIVLVCQPEHAVPVEDASDCREGIVEAEIDAADLLARGRWPRHHAAGEIGITKRACRRTTASGRLLTCSSRIW
jgi:hypothetical protein